MRSNKSIARQNLLVSVVNVALERGLVTLAGHPGGGSPHTTTLDGCHRLDLATSPTRPTPDRLQAVQLRIKRGGQV
jgi:hypothetical protein